MPTLLSQIDSVCQDICFLGRFFNKYFILQSLGLVSSRPLELARTPDWHLCRQHITVNAFKDKIIWFYWFYELLEVNSKVSIQTGLKTVVSYFYSKHWTSCLISSHFQYVSLSLNLAKQLWVSSHRETWPLETKVGLSKSGEAFHRESKSFT